MPKTGRPRLNITTEEIEKLSRIGATQPEMAKWFGVSLSTIEKRLAKDPFHTAMNRGYAAFDISLRRKQAQVAEEGNPTMLIWLGKQRLGQRDNLDQKLIGTGPAGEIEVNANISPTDVLRSRIALIAERRRAGGSTS